MDFEKSISSFEIKEISVAWLLNIYFSEQILNTFPPLLLCEINVLDNFDMGDFFQIFFISQSTETLIESNVWLGMYMSYILKWLSIFVVVRLRYLYTYLHEISSQNLNPSLRKNKKFQYKKSLTSEDFQFPIEQTRTKSRSSSTRMSYG